MCGYDAMGIYWTVAKFVKNHTCDMELFRNCPQQVSTRLIDSVIVSILQHNGHIIRLRDVVGEMQMDHGISILYNKALRAKEYAQNMVYGDPLHSFQLLLSYCYMLERKSKNGDKTLD